MPIGKTERLALLRLRALLKGANASREVRAAISDPDAPARVYLETWALPIIDALLSEGRERLLRLRYHIR